MSLSQPVRIAHPRLGSMTVGLSVLAPTGSAPTHATAHRVLLLGGSGQTPATWRETERALAAAGCEVATAAGRGITPTEAPPLPWTLDDLAADALAVLDHLGWRQPVTVIGYSLGGFTTELLARTHPERVEHAVLVAAHHRASAFARAARDTAAALTRAVIGPVSSTPRW